MRFSCLENRDRVQTHRRTFWLFNIDDVWCPKPYCSPHQGDMLSVPPKYCAVSPPKLFSSSRRYLQCHPLMLCSVPTPIVPLVKKVCAVSPPSSIHSEPLSHSALSSILSKVENLISSSLQDEATD